MARDAELRRPLRLALAVVATGAVLSACSGGPSSHGGAPPTTAPPTTGTTAAPAPSGGPPPVPTSGAYLGAWVNPTATPGPEAARAAAFSAQVGKLAIVHFYLRFGAALPTKPMDHIADLGAAPMLDWGCTDTAAVASGAADGTIDQMAEALKAFGHPVFLRWFWEMNLRSPKNLACLGTGGPAGYVAAWRHLVGRFRALGVTNVAFVWCPGLNAGLASMAPYYPGDDVVDWIAVDGYLRQGPGTGGFARLFGPWYAAWAGHAKPLMIGETGAEAPDQATYLADIQSTWPTTYPDMKALVYFDAPGPHGQWQLGPAGQRAFGALAADPYFSARP